ncbi:MAG: dethiobiotin synthase [Saccharospirillaceae bacterium]|nr:dethiobiotin synthase [Pseudomonadales bacterium]NRB79455.1 dethiobiotin synthase [Saccharospirillaceae bacterium]
MRNTFFITGTDTDCGKTYSTVRMLEDLKKQGKVCIGLKPVAAGAQEVDGEDGVKELQNDDAIQIRNAASVKLSYAQVNPVCLEPAIAPHIAAKQAGRTIQLNQLEGFIKGATIPKHGEPKYDVTLVEGAGGWMVPLNDVQMLSQIAVQLKMDVIMVVGLKLGCINHALLTAQAIKNSGCNLVGWIANEPFEEMNCRQENLETLHRFIQAPCIGFIGFNQKDVEFDWDRIIK